ncbi:cyclase family protein [Herbiconiux sp. CPCC 203407]|uniref:Cyclase family protein n=1 Tax=Herbiconiux oxytropis TaxID=2970915 RepID=A0AA42BUG8_9MICO|nr:cyclase family protein [Herbiconiux oxytropis]MCS5723039.1 cyclase family protein [Herbiconiux oxytropis]MCS5726892.1 cyclase family protein [Herbiconiux oxytropis]
MRVIDLSITLDNDTRADPPFQRPRIEYTTHAQTEPLVESLFPGLTIGAMTGGTGWAVEQVTLSTHNGTHVDSPWHYHPTMNGGEPAWGIDAVPLEWFFAPGVRLDFRHLPDGYVVQPADIDAELARIGYELRPFDIVLANTAAGARLGHDDFIDSGCGFGRAATLHLIAAGIRVMGTDGWSWDAPFSATAARFAETGDPGIVWEGHKAGMEAAYCQIEKLTALETLPDFGFTVSCFPAKIRGASAGWTRAVALIEE